MAIPTTPTLLQLDNLYDILVELGENVRRGYVNKLVKNGHPTQENTLASTVTSEVIVKGTTYEVVLNLQDYWKYVEEGTRPHWPPISAIAHWIQIKPVIPRPDEKGNIPSQQSLAFLIGRAMAGKSPNQANCKNPQGGTTGTHDLKETTDALLGYYEDLIKEALERDVFDYIEKVTSEV